MPLQVLKGTKRPINSTWQAAGSGKRRAATSWANWFKKQCKNREKQMMCGEEWNVWLQSKLEEWGSMSELAKNFEKVEAELDFLRSHTDTLQPPEDTQADVGSNKPLTFSSSAGDSKQPISPECFERILRQEFHVPDNQQPGFFLTLRSCEQGSSGACSSATQTRYPQRRRFRHSSLVLLHILSFVLPSMHTGCHRSLFA